MNAEQESLGAFDCLGDGSGACGECAHCLVVLEPDEPRVYVDTFPPGWGQWTGGGHMLANDLDALHAIAAKIGLKRSWFQGDKTFAHYDVQRAKRSLAVKHGAIEIGIRELPDDVLMRREDGTYERRCDRIARRKAATS